MKRSSVLTTLLTLVLLLSFKAHAQQELHYPELTVSPLATERMMMEARSERANSFFHAHKAIQISAATTLVAGLTQYSNTDRIDDPDRNAAKVATAVGGGWFLATVAMDAWYRPYRNGYRQVQQVEGDSTRAKLSKERYAEETINALGRHARRLDYLSALTNAASSIYLLNNAESKSISKPLGAAALITSLAPLFYPSHWKNVSDRHERAKRRIYGPIALSPSLFEQNGKLVSGLQLTASF